MSNSQTYTFKNVQVYKNGEAITYTVDEETVTEYTKSLDGLTVTNSYTPGVTSVSVTKVWNDNENQDGLRPESVEVYLYGDEAEVLPLWRSLGP